MNRQFTEEEPQMAIKQVKNTNLTDNQGNEKTT